MGLQAAKDTNDSVRGAPHDSMRHATYGLVEQQTGARRTGQSLVVEGVVFITSGVRSDRTDETLFNRNADGTTHGNLTTEEKGLKRVFGVEKATAIVGGAARGETADRRHDKG